MAEQSAGSAGGVVAGDRRVVVEALPEVGPIEPGVVGVGLAAEIGEDAQHERGEQRRTGFDVLPEIRFELGAGPLR